VTVASLDRGDHARRQQRDDHDGHRELFAPFVPHNGGQGKGKPFAFHHCVSLDWGGIFIRIHGDG
jgi:hypothetical protein